MTYVSQETINATSELNEIIERMEQGHQDLINKNADLLIRAQRLLEIGQTERDLAALYRNLAIDYQQEGARIEDELQRERNSAMVDRQAHQREVDGLILTIDGLKESLEERVKSMHTLAQVNNELLDRYAL